MSDSTNDELIERAREVSEQYVGTYLPKAIDNLIEKNELEQLEYVVKLAEQEQEQTDVH